MSDISFREWLVNFEAGKYESSDTGVQIDAGWYDWFCEDFELKDRLNALVPVVLAVSKSNKIDLDKNYIFFKNNCPMVGDLYDDFRVCDIVTGDVIFTIAPYLGYTHLKGVAEVHGRENDFEKPLASGTVADIYDFFGVSSDIEFVPFISENVEDGEEDDYWDEDEEETWEDEYDGSEDQL